MRRVFAILIATNCRLGPVVAWDILILLTDVVSFITAAGEKSKALIVTVCSLIVNSFLKLQRILEIFPTLKVLSKICSSVSFLHRNGVCFSNEINTTGVIIILLLVRSTILLGKKSSK